MGLVRQTGLQRDLRQRQIGFEDQPPGMANPALGDIGVRGRAHGVLERAGEMVLAEPGDRGELSGA